MFWKRLSVTWKLFAAIALTTAVIVAFMAVMVAVSMRSGFSQYLLQAEIDRFDGLTETLADDYDPAAAGWPELAGDPDAWRAFTREHAVMPPSGQLAPPGGAARRPPPVDPLQIGNRLALLDGEGNRLVGPDIAGAQAATRQIDVVRDGRSTTVGWIALAAPEGGIITADNVFIAGQLRTLILTALLAVAVSALVAFLLARQFLAPVRALVAGTEVLAGGDYAQRMENRRGDEFGELIDHFNVLAESLDQAEKSERQWLSDASHELQTPLAVLRAQIEALQDGVRQADDKTLAEMKGAVLRLSELVADLNALSHAREGKLLTAMADENLSAIVDEAAEAVRDRLADAGLAFETDIEPGLAFRCDRMRIRQMVDNLLENARRYTSAPGRVSLTLDDLGQTIVLRVEDTAPAPPEEAMAKLFDRFYRADPSRARQRGGSGLGLAICRAIVLAHGGTIDAGRSDMGGLAVRVSLPKGEGA